MLQVIGLTLMTVSALVATFVAFVWPRDTALHWWLFRISMVTFTGGCFLVVFYP